MTEDKIPLHLKGVRPLTDTELRKFNDVTTEIVKAMVDDGYQKPEAVCVFVLPDWKSTAIGDACTIVETTSFKDHRLLFFDLSRRL